MVISPVAAPTDGDAPADSLHDGNGDGFWSTSRLTKVFRARLRGETPANPILPSLVLWKLRRVG
jgi:hypothetical protein